MLESFSEAFFAALSAMVQLAPVGILLPIALIVAKGRISTICDLGILIVIVSGLAALVTTLGAALVQKLRGVAFPGGEIEGRVGGGQVSGCGYAVCRPAF
jgi:Na+/H+-dicarboxylate symporter